MGPELNAVISGASSAIAGAIATAIASTGSAVWLVGRDAARLETIAHSVIATARAVRVYQADLTIDSAVEELASQVRNEFGVLDVLVHCAGAFNRLRPQMSSRW
jgi:gluconate 5-dehydrogenase